MGLHNMDIALTIKSQYIVQPNYKSTKVGEHVNRIVISCTLNKSVKRTQLFTEIHKTFH